MRVYHNYVSMVLRSVFGMVIILFDEVNCEIYTNSIVWLLVKRGSYLRLGSFYVLISEKKFIIIVILQLNEIFSLLRLECQAKIKVSSESFCKGWFGTSRQVAMSKNKTTLFFYSIL